MARIDFILKTSVRLGETAEMLLKLNNLQFLDGNCFLPQFHVSALSAFLFIFLFVELGLGKR